MGAAMVRFGSNLYLTPARTGLLMVALFLLGGLALRVISVSDSREVRTLGAPDKLGEVAPDIGIRDLRTVAAITDCRLGGGFDNLRIRSTDGLI